MLCFSRFVCFLSIYSVCVAAGAPYSRLSFSFESQGCLAGSDLCDIENEDVGHVEAYFDATSLLASGRDTTLSGRVIVTVNHPGETDCPDFSESGIPDENKIFLLSNSKNVLTRKCTFPMLSEQARKRGAKGLIIPNIECKHSIMHEQNFHPEYCKNLTDSGSTAANKFGSATQILNYARETEQEPPSKGKPVSIPIFFVSHETGILLQQCLLENVPHLPAICKKGTTVQADLQWNMLNQKRSIQFEILDHVYHKIRPVFFQDPFTNVFLPILLRENSDMGHRIVLNRNLNSPCEDLECDDLDCYKDICVNDTHARSNNITGTAIMQEAVRRFSMRNFLLKSVSDKLKFWHYMNDFYDNCQLTQNFTRKCSLAMMEQNGIQVDSIQTEFTKSDLYSVLNKIEGQFTEFHYEGEDSLTVFNNKLIPVDYTNPEEYLRDVLQAVCHALRTLKNYAKNAFAPHCECQYEDLSNVTVLNQCVALKKEELAVLNAGGNGNKDNEAPNTNKNDSQASSFWMVFFFMMMFVLAIVSVAVFNRSRQIQRERNMEMREIIQDMPEIERQSDSSARGLATEYLTPISKPEAAEEIQLA